VVRSVAEDEATAVVWPAITFKPVPVRTALATTKGTAGTGSSLRSVAGHEGEADDWSDAQAAFVEATGGGDESGPPIEDIESRMGAEIAGRDGVARGRSDAKSTEDAEESAAALPELDALIARIPPEVRAALDELFRARFQAVRRIPRKAFASATGKTLAT
jgi:hypothetical protein